MVYSVKLLKILNREVDNLDLIYLYKETDGWWTAYQTSARRLQALFPDLIIESTIMIERYIYLKHTRIRYEKIATLDPNYYVIDKSRIIISPPKNKMP